MKFANFAFCLAAMAWPAVGGVELSMRVEQPGSKQPPADQKVWLEKDRLRVEFQTGDQQGTFIYRKDKDAFYHVDPADRSYVEFARADLEAMGRKLGEMRAKMQEAMKDMPPEQRAMMEKMMGGAAQEAAPAKIDYRKTGSGKVGAWKVAEYDVLRDGKKTARASIADFSALGLVKEDFAVLQDIAAFTRDLAKNLPQVSGMEHLDFFGSSESLPGLPVRVVGLDETGKEETRMEVTAAKKTAIAASQFEVPAGFKRKKADFSGAGSAAPEKPGKR